MDILDKITQLRQAKHWSEYQLAIEADIPQSTISSWYNKKIYPTIPTLMKLCDAFDVTLSYFFLDLNYSVNLTKNQIELLNNFAKLSSEQQTKLVEFLKLL